MSARARYASARRIVSALHQHSRGTGRRRGLASMQASQRERARQQAAARCAPRQALTRLVGARAWTRGFSAAPAAASVGLPASSSTRHRALCAPTRSATRSRRCQPRARLLACLVRRRACAARSAAGSRTSAARFERATPASGKQGCRFSPLSEGYSKTQPKMLPRLYEGFGQDDSCRRARGNVASRRKCRTPLPVFSFAAVLRGSK